MRQWLIDIRKQCGMTQLEVARSTGIARSYYTRIERGDYHLPVSTAMQIAAVLGFDWQLFYPDAADNTPTPPAPHQ